MVLMARSSVRLFPASLFYRGENNRGSKAGETEVFGRDREHGSVRASLSRQEQPLSGVCILAATLKVLRAPTTANAHAKSRYGALGTQGRAVAFTTQ